MNRRELCATLGTTGLALSAGCSALSNDERGYTYALTLTDADDDPAGRVLDYDTAGLTRSQKDILEEAIETGSYSEENVAWDSLPGRKGISMEFRMVIQLIARHVGRDPEVQGTASFETASRYDGATYRSIVDVE